MANDPTPQQQETLEYFRRAAEAWRTSAGSTSATEVNIIAQRNDVVLEVAEGLPRLRAALDIGCGTGELALALAARGVEAVGVDFAPEMIALCDAKKREVAATKATFVTASIFDYEPGRAFDLISANGFIEYISPAELEQLFARAVRWLRPGGTLVLGSRNRLFNVFSLNQFTRMESERGTVPALLAEATTIAEADSTVDMLARLLELPTELPVMAAHPRAGVTVETRHQYTPAELGRAFVRNGFRPTAVRPVHYHGVTPAFGREHPEIHATIANLLQPWADHRLLPFASSFMMAGALA